MKNNPCFTLEHCLHDLRSRLLFLKRASLWSHLAHPSPTTRARACTHTHTHTHTHTLPDCWTVPVIADPLSGMACANQRNVLLPLEKGAFHNHALRILLCESCLWLSSGCLCVQVSSFQRLPYVHYISRGSPVIPEWWVFSPQLITYGVWEFHFF